MTGVPTICFTITRLLFLPKDSAHLDSFEPHHQIRNAKKNPKRTEKDDRHHNSVMRLREVLFQAHNLLLYFSEGTIALTSIVDDIEQQNPNEIVDA